MRDKPACENCKYWGHMSSPAPCHRRAPVLGSDGWGGRWPVTQPKDWCGEHEYKLCEHVWDKQWIPDHKKPYERYPACSKCHAVKGVDA